MSSYDLPRGWKVEALARHVASLESGSRPRGGVSRYAEGIPSISAEQMNPDGSFRWEAINYVPEEFYASSSKGIIRTKDILIVKDGATTGKCAFVDDDFPHKRAMVNEHTFILRTKATLHPKLAYYFLKSPYCSEFFEIAREHGVIGGLNHTFPSEIQMPVPPFEEQVRIVSKIEESTRRADEASRLCEAARLESSGILGSCIERAVSRVSDEYVPLSDFLSERPRNGWSPTANNLPGNGIPVLTLSAVTGFRYDGSKVKWTSAKADESAHYWLKLEELLITRSNTPELVGHAAIYDGEPSPCICPDLIMKMRVRHEIANTSFIHYWLQSTMVRDYIRKNARGTSGSMKKINQTHVMNIPVPKVPLPLQDRIVEYLGGLRARLDELLRLQAEAEAELATFTPAVLTKAFRGEL